MPTFRAIRVGNNKVGSSIGGLRLNLSSRISLIKINMKLLDASRLCQFLAIFHSDYWAQQIATSLSSMLKTTESFDLALRPFVVNSNEVISGCGSRAHKMVKNFVQV